MKFYNEHLGFDFKLGAGFVDNPVMAATAGAPGASFRQSRSLIPGTPVTMTFIELRNIDGKMSTGRTQDPGTTVLQLRVRDVAALTAKVKVAGVPVVTTGGAPVEIVPGLEISIVRDPSNVLLELVESQRQCERRRRSATETHAKVAMGERPPLALTSSSAHGLETCCQRDTGHCGFS